jgi:predicted metal-dependent hydrolase
MLFSQKTTTKKETINNIAVVFKKTKINKRIVFSIKDNYVLVTLPYLCSFAQGKKLVIKNEAWVKNNFSKRNKDDKEKNIEELREKAKTLLPEKVKKLANFHGFNFNKLFIKDMKTRWGSCSTIRNINLNLRLVLLPEHLIDYVILHELNHLKHPHHQKEFWDSLSTICNTNAKLLQRELKKIKL